MELTLFMGNNGSGNSSKAGPTRRRKITTCRSCTIRRVKCDRQRPECSTCRQRGDKCEYFQQPSKREVHQLSGDSSTSSSISRPVADDSQKSGSDSISKSKRKKTANEDAAASAGTDTGMLAVNPETGVARFATPAFWPHFFPDIQKAQVLRESDPFGVRRSRESSEFVLLREQLLASYLPERATCDSVFEFYCDWILPFSPIIARRDLKALYASFWRQREQQQQQQQQARPQQQAQQQAQQQQPETKQVHPHFFAVVFATLYCGSLALSAKMRYVRGAPRLLDYDPLEAEIAVYLRASESALQICEFAKRPSLISLLAEVCLQTCRPAETDTSATCLISLLIRAAQTMGLHRDPELFKASMSESDMRLRRNIWYNLKYLDLVTAFICGLPPTLKDRANDVAPPKIGDMLDEDAIFMLASLSVQYSICSRNEITEYFERSKSSEERLEAVLNQMKLSSEQHLEHVRKASSLTFSERSEEADIDRLRWLKEYMIYITTTVHEKTKLLLLNYQYRLKCASLNVPQTAPSEDPEAASIWEQSVLSGLRVLKFCNCKTSEMAHPEVIWYETNYPQFHSIITVLKDVCYNPHRKLWVTYDEVLECAGMPRERFVENIDERLESARECMQNSIMLGFNDDSDFSKSQWKKLEDLYAMAQRALESSSEMSRTSASATAGFVSSDARTASESTAASSLSISTPERISSWPAAFGGIAQDGAPEPRYDLANYWNDVETMLASVLDSEDRRTGLIDESPFVGMEQFFADGRYNDSMYT
ncbi:hypothetical protein BZA70DRAFT_269474 [Myxozyma melibiosi]|uniref:Zn(2)-C6 fungal-type domain-containing protein n=1 Tax=Myxozyma melibiosi TaxID=54550 RepID=A0ABR1F061_9ASCO